MGVIKGLPSCRTNWKLCTFWAILFVCSFFAMGPFAQGAGVFPCGLVPSLLDLATYADSAGSVAVRGCVFEDANTQFYFNERPLNVEVSNLVVIRGSVQIGFGPKATNSCLLITNTTAVGCAHCFSVTSGGTVADFQMKVYNSTFRATSSAVSFIVTVMERSTIVLANTTISVDATTGAALCGSVAGPSIQWPLRITSSQFYAVHSILHCSTKGSSAASLGIVASGTASSSLTVIDVVLSAVQSELSAYTQGNVAVSLGMSTFAYLRNSPSSAAVVVRGVQLLAVASVIRADALGCAVASVGFVCYGYSEMVGATDGTLEVSTSSAVEVSSVTVDVNSSHVNAAGSDSVAAIGIASRAHGICHNFQSGRCSWSAPSSITASSVSMRTTASIISAQGTSDSTAAVGYTSYGTTSKVSVVASSIRVEGGSVAATGGQAVACGGVSSLADLRQELTASQLVFETDSSAVRAEAASTASCFGLAAWSLQACRWNVGEVSLRASGSQLSTHANNYAVGLGFGAGGVTTEGSIVGFSASSHRTQLTATGVKGVAAASVMVLSADTTNLVSTYSVQLIASSSMISAVASSESAHSLSFGISGGNAGCAAVDFTIAAIDSRLYSNGTKCVTAMGASMCGHASAVLNVVNLVLEALHCDVRSDGTDGVSSGGVAAVSDGVSNAQANNATLLFSYCNVSSHGANAVVSGGLVAIAEHKAAFSTTSSVTSLQVLLYAEGSVISAAASGRAVSSMGFASYAHCENRANVGGTLGVSTSSTVEVTGVEVVVNRSQVYASGVESVSAIGVASSTFVVCTNTGSGNCAKYSPSVATAINTSFVASQSSIEGVSTTLTAVLAVASLGVSRMLQVRVCRSSVFCTACAAVMATTPDSKTVSSTGRFQIISSTISAPSGDCLGIAPKNTNERSVMQDSTLNCGAAGWASVCDGCCGTNVTVSGAPLSTATFNGFAVDGADCPIALLPLSCDAILPRPRIVPQYLADWERDEIKRVGGTLTHSLQLSQTKVPPISVSSSHSSIDTARTRSSTHSQPTQRSSRSSPSSIPTSSASIVPQPPVAHTNPLEAALPTQAAKAVVITTATSVGVTSVILSPTSAASINRLLLVGASINCRFNDNTVEPSEMQYPIPLPDTDAMVQHAVGCGSCVAIVVLVVVLELGLRRFTTCVKVLVAVEATMHQFYLPSLVQGGVLVLLHADNNVAKATCGASLSIEIGLLLLRAWIVLRRVPREAQFEISVENGRRAAKAVWRGKVVDEYGPFFDSTRDIGSAAVRLAFFFEALSSSVIGFAAGWRPREGSCAGVAFGMLASSLSIFVFLVWSHPYSRKLDSAFSFLSSFMLVMQCVTATLLTLTGWAGGESVLAWMTLAQCGIVFVQWTATIVWRAALNFRHRVEHECDGDGRSGISSHSVALLAMPDPALSNPLGK